jgi:hypothetical protein
VAIAVSDSTGDIGVGTAAPSEDAARRSAIAKCGRSDCKIVIAEKDMCVAMMLARDDSYFTAAFDTREGAGSLVEIQCAIYNKGECPTLAATPCASDDSRTAPPFPLPPLDKNVVVDPRVAGAWEYTWSQGRWVWVIDPHGGYVFHTEAPDNAPSHSGEFKTPTKGQWTLTSRYGFEDYDGGDYVMPDPDTMVMTSKNGPGTWHRIKAPPPARKK